MWNYTDKVMEHFKNPKNVGEMKNASAVGEVGNISCGDALKLMLEVNDDEIIVAAKFQTFGCASAIASSSALTEIIKGMSLDEASKITNKNIVDYLGELPEEKIHCSVMGMEALEAAINNYRGIKLEEDEDNEGQIICHCFGITDQKLYNIAKEYGVLKAENMKNYCKAGGACGCCLDKIQNIIDDVKSENCCDPKTNIKLDKETPVQIMMKIQNVIEKEVKPVLEKDGGSILFINLVNNIVQVKLQGKCASCPSSQVTLKNTVQEKLREFVKNDLIVEEV